MNRCPIFICGLPGSGKSHFGKQLAASLNIPFSDLDELITEQYDTPAALIQNKGEAEFRRLESVALQKWVKKEHGVLALGGGTPCYNGHMKWLISQGVVVYIKENVDVIVGRINISDSKRPLIVGESKGEIRLKLRGLLLKRSRFYNQSQLISGSKPAQTLDLYTNRLKLLTKM